MEDVDDCQLVATFDPSGLNWSNFEESDLDWPSLVLPLRRIVASEQFRKGSSESTTQLYRLYGDFVDDLNTMGSGWFMSFVAGNLFANGRIPTREAEPA